MYTKYIVYIDLYIDLVNIDLVTIPLHGVKQKIIVEINIQLQKRHKCFTFSLNLTSKKSAQAKCNMTLCFIWPDVARS